MTTVIDALAGFAPGQPALSDDRGTLSAAELLAAVANERAWMAGHGEHRWALLADNGRGWAISDLALLADRRASVPLPHHFSTGQLGHAITSSGVTAVLTDTPEGIVRLGLGFTLAGESPATGLALLLRPMPEALPALPAGTVKVTYTSGSTADPKGVCLAAGAMQAVAASVAAVAGPLGIRRHLAVLPLATLLENVAGLYAAWLAGACCNLASTAAGAIARGTLSPQLLLAEVTKAAPESVILVPELLRILVGGADAGWQPPAGARFFAVGGARVSPDLLARADAAGLPVYEGYGLSECASVVCLNTPGARRAGTVGRPLPHARLRVDAAGEIHVAGATMAGYVGGEPLAPGAWIATGDLGQVDDAGFVQVQGRAKNLFINSYGRNLSPEWIESEVGQEPAIGQVVVFGEARPDVAALVTPAAPGIPAAAVAAAIARANSRLPGYARVARYQLVGERMTVANGLLTGNGRPRRQQILERYAHTLDRLWSENSHVVQ